MAKLKITTAPTNPDGLCSTCGRAPYAPYRRVDERGRVIEGCVDGCHTGQLVPVSESQWWHNRQEAERIRRGMARMRGTA